MRTLLNLLRTCLTGTNPSKTLAALSIGAGLLVINATPALANHISTATATTSCTSYTINLSATSLTPKTSYTIQYTITLKPSTGAVTTVNNSITFTAPSNGTYNATLTNPLNLVTNDYQLTGTATLAGKNTIAISFTPASFTCDCPD